MLGPELLHVHSPGRLCSQELRLGAVSDLLPTPPGLPMPEWSASPTEEKVIRLKMQRFVSQKKLLGTVRFSMQANEGQSIPANGRQAVPLSRLPSQGVQLALSILLFKLVHHRTHV